MKTKRLLFWGFLKRTVFPPKINAQSPQAAHAPSDLNIILSHVSVGDLLLAGFPELVNLTSGVEPPCFTFLLPPALENCLLTVIVWTEEGKL